MMITIMWTLKNCSMKITYHKKFDLEYQTDVQRYLDVDIDAKKIVWIIYQPAPKDMHFKYADMAGLDIEHKQSEQTFEEFLKSPSEEIDGKQYEVIKFFLRSDHIYISDAEELKKEHGISSFTKDDRYSSLEYLIQFDNDQSIWIYIPKTPLQSKLDDWLMNTNYSEV